MGVQDEKAREIGGGDFVDERVCLCVCWEFESDNGEYMNWKMNGIEKSIAGASWKVERELPVLQRLRM